MLNYDATENLLARAVDSGSGSKLVQAFDEMVSCCGPAGAAAAAYRAIWRTGKVGLIGSLRGAKSLRVSRRSCRTIALYHYRVGIGGAEAVFLELAKMFLSAGYGVVLLHDEPLPEGVDIDSAIRCEALPLFESCDAGNYIARARRLEEVLTRQEVDLLIYNQWIGHVLPWDMMVAKALGVAFVVHVHGSFPTMMRWGAEHIGLLPIAYHVADAVVCLSETNREFWREVNPQVFVTDNPIRFKCDSAQAAPLSGHDVLWIARIEPAKGPEEALEIFREVVGAVPDARLHIVGGGPAAYLDSLWDRAESLGIGRSVIFHGAQEDPRPFYERASVMLMTSAEEGFPLVVGESKVFGLPVVMYDLPYLTFCEDPRGLLSVPQGDRKGAAHAIIALLQDDGLRSKFGADAREDALRFEGHDRLSFWKDVVDAAMGSGLTQGGAADDCEIPPATWRMRSLFWEEFFQDARRRASRVSDLQSQLADKDALIAELNSSTSMRVGRALTAVPRAMKDRRGVK